MKLDEKAKMIALAYLHQGKSPREVEELVPGISYAQALRLRKELDAAIKDNTLAELFSLEQAALDTLLEGVQLQLEDAAKILTGDDIQLKSEIASLADGVQTGRQLEADINRAASVVVAKLQIIASTSNNFEAIVACAESLAKLQTAFFKTGNINIANFPNGSKFEQFLQP